MAEERLKQFAYKIFSIKRRYSAANPDLLGLGDRRTQASKKGTP